MLVCKVCGSNELTAGTPSANPDEETRLRGSVHTARLRPERAPPGHIHDPSNTRQMYTCSNGHETPGAPQAIDPCPVKGCDWNSNHFGLPDDA